MTVPILIASEFLRMEALTGHCLDFVSENLTRVVSAQADWSFVRDPLVARLARAVSGRDLLRAEDKRGALLPRLYRAKIEVEFCGHGDQMTTTTMMAAPKLIDCCRRCGRLYTEPPAAMRRERAVGSCPASSRRVDRRGGLGGTPCEPTQGWKLAHCTAPLRRRGVPWAEIFWRLFRMGIYLEGGEEGTTTTAGRFFSADTESDGRHCPQPAAFGTSSAFGLHPCCGRLAVRYDPWEDDNAGCRKREVHFPPPKARGELELYELAMEVRRPARDGMFRQKRTIRGVLFSPSGGLTAAADPPRLLHSHSRHTYARTRAIARSFLDLRPSVRKGGSVPRRPVFIILPTDGNGGRRPPHLLVHSRGHPAVHGKGRRRCPPREGRRSPTLDLRRGS